MLYRLGSDPEKVFPYSALEDQLRKFAKYGLTFASFFLPIFTSGMDAQALTDDIQNENNNNNNNSNSPQISDDCKKRIRDIVADMFRLGYL